MSSCASLPKYLPKTDNIDVNQYGSFIKVHTLDKSVKGELIAVDSVRIIVLSHKKHITKINNIPIERIKYFKLFYARSKKYGWTIPLYAISTVSHGYWLLFSAPLNIIATTAVASSGQNDFTYNKKTITYKELKMFARFPQGIPPNVDINKIDYRK